MSSSWIKRGDIYLADLSPVTGSEQGGLRPVLVYQNNVGNRFSPTVAVAAITSQIQKAKLPTHVEIKTEKYKIERDSVILLEQVRTVDKERLDYENKITVLDDEDMMKVDLALLVSSGLLDIFKSEEKIQYIKNLIKEGIYR
jgi:mRNA interferase MazF